jgi:hypothetical protein
MPIRQLADFARYVYLPRLRDPEVLVAAVQDGLGLLLGRTSPSCRRVRRGDPFPP